MDEAQHNHSTETLLEGDTDDPNDNNNYWIQQINEILMEQLVRQNRNPQEDGEFQREITDLILNVEEDTLISFMN